MATRRTRRFTRTRAGSKGGRSYYWFRFTPFFMQLREAATATHSDLFLTESDWSDPSVNLNQTRRGGARLERMIVDFGLALDTDQAFNQASGGGNIALIPEFMVWKQTDQSATLVQDFASFVATRQNQRILMDEVPAGARELDIFASTYVARSVQGRYETKSKVRLSEGALGCAWHGFFNTGDETLNGYTDWFRPTLLISVP